MFSFFLVCLLNLVDSTKPIMGWSTWEALAKFVDETSILENMKILEDSGLLASGYSMIQIDDGWFLMDRKNRWVPRGNYTTRPKNQKGPNRMPGLIGNGDPGCLIAEPTKFPRGMKALGEEIKSRGFQFGMYTSGEMMFCQTTNHPFKDPLALTYASPPYMNLREIDAKCFIDWGVDLVKVDYCRPPKKVPWWYAGNIIASWRGLLPPHVKLYNSRYGCLAKTKCKNVYKCPLSVSPFDNPLDNHCTTTANLYRTGIDMKPNWKNIVAGILSRLGRGAFSKPGSWADPDYLIPHSTLVSYTESRSQFGMWCVVSAPLLISVDLRYSSSQTLELLKNPHAIRVNQEYYGDSGDILYRVKGLIVLRKKLKDGEVAIVAVNLGRGYQTNSNAPAYFSPNFIFLSSIIGANSCNAFNVWDNTTFEIRPGMGFAIAARDSVFLLISDCKITSSPTMTEGTPEPSVSPIFSPSEQVSSDSTPTRRNKTIKKRRNQ